MISSEKVNNADVGVLSGNPSTKLVHGTVRTTTDGTPSQTLCILGVPGYIGVGELWHTFTSPESDTAQGSVFAMPQTSSERNAGIKAVKLLRSEADAGKYVILVVFENESSAARFHSRNSNGKGISSYEMPEVCTVFYVSDVAVPEKATCFGPSVTLRDIFVPSKTSDKRDCLPLTQQQPQSEASCSFCSDDITIGDGYPVLITQCGHCFHAECIAKWANDWCPLCRCPLQPLPDTDDDPTEVVSCCVCGCSDAENLWECLICAHVGCGKPAGTHANEHYAQTGHAFSFNIESKRVWDYTRAVYVSRIVLNKTDGKPVEVESKDEKIGNLEAYYLQLMDVQKSSFDSEVRDLIQCHKQDMARKKSRAAELEVRLKELRRQVTLAHERNAGLTAQNDRLTKENAAADKVISALTKRTAQLEASEKDQSAMVQQMQENGPLWKKKFDALERKYKSEKDKLQAEIDSLEKENQELLSKL